MMKLTMSSLVVLVGRLLVDHRMVWVLVELMGGGVLNRMEETDPTAPMIQLMGLRVEVKVRRGLCPM